jgi:hypothetical protein
MSITLEEAQGMVERARAHAVTIGVPMNISGSLPGPSSARRWRRARRRGSRTTRRAWGYVRKQPRGRDPGKPREGIDPGQAALSGSYRQPAKPRLARRLTQNRLQAGQIAHPTSGGGGIRTLENRELFSARRPRVVGAVQPACYLLPSCT